MAWQRDAALMIGACLMRRDQLAQRLNRNQRHIAQRNHHIGYAVIQPGDAGGDRMTLTGCKLWVEHQIDRQLIKRRGHLIGLMTNDHSQIINPGITHRLCHMPHHRFAGNVSQ